MLFYKGVLVSDLSEKFIPGSVTTELHVAEMWANRISSKKSKGAARHVRHGRSCVVEIEFDGVLISHDEFQRPGVKEHKRLNCWMNAVKDKAQINTECAWRII